MGFERLKFTREWTNAEDFPTVETDEVQVRADMQALHNENKEGLNRLMDALEAAVGAAKLGAVSPDGGESTVQQELSALYEGMIKAGALPVGGSTDQVLAKSSGENYQTRWANIAEIVEALRGAAGGVASLSDEGRIPAAQMPGYLQRTSLLSVDTAAKFGLGSDAVLDDAFAAAKSLIDAVNANAETKAKIAHGTYVGTGTYGEANPNSLTFDFEPKFIWIYGHLYGSNDPLSWRGEANLFGFIFPDKLTTSYANVTFFSQNGYIFMKKSADEKTFHWYDPSDASYQLNYAAASQTHEYRYLALG